MAASRDGMVLVPAGSFLMGSDEFARETPPHTVDLPAFWIDRFPVTNAAYLPFVTMTGWRPVPGRGAPSTQSTGRRCPVAATNGA